MSIRSFPWHPKGGVHPPINLEAFLKEILAKALKLCMYNHLDMLESSEKFCGISDIFDVFVTSSMSDFFVILQFLAAAKCHKDCRNF